MSCLLEDFSAHLGYCHDFEGMLNFILAHFILLVTLQSFKIVFEALIIFVKCYCILFLRNTQPFEYFIFCNFPFVGQ